MTADTSAPSGVRDEGDAPRERPLVIYHANCWDGFCAAWVCRLALGEIEAVPAHYGSTPPGVKGRVVYVVDFSWPREILVAMHRDAADLRVIDHHATARDALVGLPYCVFDMERSGGRLTWDQFNEPDAPRPWLVDYTEDRDLWRHALPDSQEINAALRSHPLDFALWDRFTADPDLPQRFAEQGAAIRRAEKQIVDAHVRNAGRMALAGHDVPVVNATTLFSEIAGTLAEGEPFAVCYFDQQDGKRQWSLRSRDGGEDVSEIAKQFGGGGHKHAAGFETELPAQFLGATNRLTEGRLTNDDEGELRIAIGHRDGNVVIDFGTPTTWVGLPPKLARQLATFIFDNADNAD